MRGEKLSAGVRSIGAAFVECFLPQFCVLCETKIHSNEKLCSRCAGSLEVGPVFFCPLCRFEGREERGAERQGRVCSDESHSFMSGRAAVRAGSEILGLVHRFKYSGERELSSLLAQLVLDSGIVDEEFRDFHIMCPVPLFRTRLRERGFNQSAEIARRLESHSGVPLIVDLVSKARPTAEQAKLTGDSRRRNLLGTFVATRESVASGKSVVLVDDIVTTGSTVVACAESLRASGARRVLVVAVAA